MQYTYEFEMWRGEFGWLAEPFALEGITQGVDVADLCESAADLLREIVQHYLMRGEEPPRATFDNEPRHDGVRLVVSVDASLDHVQRMSATEAARTLGVSRSRITAMLNAGLLEGWREGRNTWITRDSVNARKAAPIPKGRPKKSAEEPHSIGIR